MKFMEKEINRNNTTVKHAIEHVSAGEASGKKAKKIDGEEFWHLFISWLISGIVICAVLIILTMAENSNNLFKDMIMRIDTVSLMFSLVLSAGLEQIWNNKKIWKYKLTQIGEVFLAIIGLIMYLAYSLWDLYDPENLYFKSRFWGNLLYILASFICVLVGFFMRSRIED